MSMSSEAEGILDSSFSSRQGPPSRVRATGTAPGEPQGYPGRREWGGGAPLRSGELCPPGPGGGGGEEGVGGEGPGRRRRGGGGAAPPLAGGHQPPPGSEDGAQSRLLTGHQPRSSSLKAARALQGPRVEPPGRRNTSG